MITMVILKLFFMKRWLRRVIQVSEKQAQCGLCSSWEYKEGSSWGWMNESQSKHTEASTLATLFAPAHLQAAKRKLQAWMGKSLGTSKACVSLVFLFVLRLLNGLNCWRSQSPHPSPLFPHPRLSLMFSLLSLPFSPPLLSDLVFPAVNEVLREEFF